MGTSVTSVAYDVENRVTQITYPSSATNTFAYNGEDLRTQKVDSGGTKNYVCDGSSPASAVLKDGAAVYTPGLSERRSGTSKFLHADALGSTRGITDSTQAVTDSMLYDAFGNVLSRTGTTPTPFGFVGGSQYQSDSDSGLQLLGHRYYDPSIGRFLSQDPIQDGTNWYAYCDNAPLGKTDQLGLVGEAIKQPWKPGKTYPSPKPINNYPPNEGFDGPPRKITLRPGTLIDRLGPTDGSKDGGTYVTDPGEAPWDVSLPPNSEGWQNGGTRYQVIKAIPNVKKGKAAPVDWKKLNPTMQPDPDPDQDPGKGGGIQYNLPKSIQQLLKDKFIKKV